MFYLKIITIYMTSICMSKITKHTFITVNASSSDTVGVTLHELLQYQKWRIIWSDHALIFPILLACPICTKEQKLIYRKLLLHNENSKHTVWSNIWTPHYIIWQLYRVHVCQFCSKQNANAVQKFTDYLPCLNISLCFLTYAKHPDCEKCSWNHLL